MIFKGNSGKRGIIDKKRREGNLEKGILPNTPRHYGAHIVRYQNDFILIRIYIELFKNRIDYENQIVVCRVGGPLLEVARGVDVRLVEAAQIEGGIDRLFIRKLIFHSF